MSHYVLFLLEKMDVTRVVWIFKPIGKTPKECVIECQKLHPDDKLSFAGRLDPMACGLMPIIINDSKNSIRDSIQEKYKTYRFNVILGLQSDTYDILGIVKRRDVVSTQISAEQLEQIRKTKVQTYPAYSSKTVFSPHHNKQVALWELAKLGMLPDELPTREVDVVDIHIMSTTAVTNEQLLKIVSKRISSVSDDSGFRRSDILECWNKLLGDAREYTIYSLEARVSVGTYIRTIADQLGGITYDICRTSVDGKSLGNHEYDYFKFVYDV
jgi:tRNA pseudouridine(55) synthase